MKFEIHVHIHHHGVEAALDTLLTRTLKMSQDIDDLVREVAETQTIQESAITLIVSIKNKLDEAIAANDMTAVRQASADLDAGQQRLADAILANTPQDPNPPAPEG